MAAFTGMWSLVRLILRRDRVLLPIWIILVALVPISGASGTKSLYPTDEARQGYIDDLGTSPMLTTFYGQAPLHPSLGGLIFWRYGTGLIILGLIGLLFVIRHTRVEEEAGRRELVGSTVVGRHANIAAAMVAVTGAGLAVGLLVSLAMIGMDPDSPGSAAGAVAMGLAWASAALVFGAIGAVVAQLTEGAGAARGIGIGILGVAFALRSAADIIGGAAAALNWISPLGWIYQVRAYGENRWWIFGIVILFALAMTALAIRLSSRRDVGAGMFAPRLGPAAAAPSLRSPLALAWRIHRGALLGWTAGFAAFGILIGGAAEPAAKLLQDNEQLKQIMERMGGTSAFTDVFMAGALGIFAIFVAGYGISAALQMRTEEASLRSEPLLAASVSRWGWAASHLVFALLGPVVVMVVTGVFAGLVVGASTGNIGRELPGAVGGALAQIPALWVLTTLTVAAFGLVPRLAPAIGWAALGLCVFLGQVGAVLQLSQSILDISPFTHIPRVPGGTVHATPLLVLIGLSALLAAIGLFTFRRRDIPIT